MTTQPQKKLFYGWYVAMACGIGLACGLASILTATFSLFIPPLQAEYGWQRSQLFLALTICLLVVTTAAPFMGALVDRIGARRIILVAFVLEAAIFASFKWQTESIPMLYARYVALALFALPTTHVAFSRVISVWFDKRRGLALGIALAGLGIGNAVWPVLAQWGIANYGWRNAYLILAGAILVVGMTTVALIVRDTPQSMGLAPDGVDPAASRSSASPQFGMTRAQAIRTSTFWLVLGAFVLVGVTISSLQSHLVLILIDRGVSAEMAARALSVLAIALIFGRVVAGWLMDKFFAPRVAIAFLLGPIVAIGLLSVGATGWLAFLAGVLTGLAVGAEMDVVTYLAGRYFGLRYFASIYAFFYGAFALGSAFGPLFTQIALDVIGGNRSDAYDRVLPALGVLLILGAILLARLPPFPKWDQTSGEAPAPGAPQPVRA